MMYGDRVIQRGLDFTVERGDIFAIMGGSGCGKSTLLRHLIGLIAPARGEVLYDGQSFWTAAAPARARMIRRFGVLYQSGALWSSSRTAANELRVAELDLWGGSLEYNFTGVLVENLSILLPTERIEVYPWPKSRPADYELEVGVLQLDGTPGGQCSLVAWWRVSGRGGMEVLSRGRSALTQPAGPDYRTMVEAQSRLVAELSKDIAKSIAAMPQQ